MGALGAFFLKSEGQIRAEQAVRDAQDRLLAYDPEEALDLAFHATRDAARLQVVMSQQRLTHEMVKISGNRSIAVTLIVGAILLVKGVIDPTALANAIKVMF